MGEEAEEPGAEAEREGALREPVADRRGHARILGSGPAQGVDAGAVVDFLVVDVGGTTIPRENPATESHRFATRTMSTTKNAVLVIENLACFMVGKYNYKNSYHFVVNVDV